MNKIPVKSMKRISKKANDCGGSACVRSTRIPVWSLVILRRAGVTDVNLLKMYPDLSEDDLHAAWNYEKTHRAEIDQEIKERNEEVQTESGKNQADDDIRNRRLKSFAKPEDLIDSLKKPW